MASVGRAATCVKLALALLPWAAAADAETGWRTRLVWSARVPCAGASSPRAADLDGDGTADIVIGAGAEGVAGSVTALDGRTGRLLWRREFDDQVYASAVFLRIDGAVAAVLGGRTGDVVALRGRDGRTLWSLRAANRTADLPRRNFHGAVRLPDLDRDGVPELLLPQSGQADDRERLVGRLYVASGRTGKLIRTLRLPDGAETYGLPAVLPGAILAGSGGERLPGHLFRLRLPGLQEVWRLPSGAKGFIGSPLACGGDVVAGDFAGSLYRADATTGKLRWKQSLPGFESYVSPALGRFGPGPGPLDVVTVLTRGVYPRYDQFAEVVWLDGGSGRILDRRRAGVMAAASPLVLDVDGDGRDEVLVAVNHRFGPTVKPSTVACSLLLLDGRPGRKPLWERRVMGLSHATPLLADLDGDGKLDLVHARWGTVERLAIESPARVKVRWNQFRGPRGDGVLAR